MRISTGEMDKLAGRHIDVAFMLIDPRQEKDFYLGMDDFYENGGGGRGVSHAFLGGTFRRLPDLRPWPAPTGTRTGYRRYTDEERNSWCDRRTAGARLFGLHRTWICETDGIKERNRL